MLHSPAKCRLSRSTHPVLPCANPSQYSRASRCGGNTLASRHEAPKSRRSSRVKKTGKPDTDKAGASTQSYKAQNKSVNVSGHSNGHLLFQFGGDRQSDSASGVSLGSMSVGQQWQVMVKLRKLTNGEKVDLTYQLWLDWPAGDALDGDSSDRLSTSAQPSDEFAAASDNGSAPPGHMPHPGSNGSEATSSHTAQQAGTLAMHALAHGIVSPSREAVSNQESPMTGTNEYDPALRRQWYSPQTDAAAIQTESQQSAANHNAQNSVDTGQASFSQDADQHLSDTDASSVQLQCDSASAPVTLPWPRALSRKERQVPCYQWHMVGPPIQILLTHTQPQVTANDEEAELDNEDTAAAESSSDAHNSFPTRSQLPSIPDDDILYGRLGLLTPVLRVALQLWRSFPFWLRRVLQFGRKAKGPALHASPILAQHIRTGRRTEVPGSSFKPATGRSATPLADLQRHHVENLIGCGVRNMSLYQAAFTDPSAVEPDRVIAQSFDRLEYLGDAVVQIVFAEYIYHRFPKDDSGSLSHTMATLASNKAHEQYAQHLNLARYLASNLKYMRPGFSVVPDVQADAFEALVGAIYLDRGFKMAAQFLIRVAEDVMSMDSNLSSYRNYKLYLITNVNQRNMGRITYNTKQNRANKMWLSKCFVRDKLVGMGLDTAPKQAEAAAAYAGMKHLNITETTGNRSIRRPVTII